MGFLDGITGGLSSLLGGGNNNSQFKAQGVDILNPATLNMVNQARGMSNSGINQQQQLINALNAQHGIQNQSNVFNQMQAVANGTGPNPAMAELNNATGANVANQAALMAGQRGAGANAGLLARQAALQGGNIQQQAAGQGAQLQAQQSLNALGQLGSIANNQVGQQSQAVQNYNTFAQGEQNQLLNALNAQNQNNVQMQSNLNSTNAQMAQQNAKQSGSFLGGLLNGAGGALLGAFGGPAAAAAGALSGAGSSTDPVAQNTHLAYQPVFSEGGIVEKENPKLAQVPQQERFSYILPSHLKDVASIYHPHMNCGGQVNMSKGGSVRAMVSPGELYLDPKEAKDVKKGANPLKEGQKIPGQAKVKGDSYANDTVPAKLEEGGIVIPRSVMESKDPGQAASDFVRALHKKSGKDETPEGFKAALKQAIASRKKD